MIVLDKLTIFCSAKYIISVFFLSLFFLISAGNVFADYLVSTPQANPLIITKEVAKPEKKEIVRQFVKNLTVSDEHFFPEDQINFRLVVKNTGQSELRNITVRDKLPDVLEFIAGPSQPPLNNSQTITFNIERLAPNESRDFSLQTRVKQSQFLPTTTVTCITNAAEAKVENFLSQDTSSLCIENKVLGISKELPETGPKETALILAFSLFSFAIFIVLSVIRLNDKRKF